MNRPLVTAELDRAVPRWEQAYRRHARYVANLTMRLLGSDDAVNDIVQDVFVIAQRGLTALRDPEAERGWLRTVTLRRIARHVRWRRIKGALGLGTTPDYEQELSRELPADERVLLSQVYRVLDDLPVAERLAWSLRHLEGEQLERIAELTGCSLATAKRRITAAHEAIEGALGESSGR